MSQNRNPDQNTTPDTTEPGARHYKFKFENLVLAGGGAKGVAYCGVARVLEEHGILTKITRFAGTSAGAIVAALLCIGFNSYDIEEIMRVDMKNLLFDSSWYYLRIWRCFGGHRADEFSQFIRDVIARKTNKSEITFQEVYDKFDKKELFIMVTNANKMSAECFNRKTKPDMPIWKAIRMSISIPAELTPFPFGKDGDESLYVDGGVLCNYPISCFDEGSNLPMDEEPRRATNLATLGCLVYAEDEYHTFRDQIERKCNVPMWVAPNTKLARKKPDERIEKKLTDFENTLPRKKRELLKLFQDSDGKEEFSFEEFERILKRAWDKGNNPVANEDESVRAGTYFKDLYGADVTARMIFDKIMKEDTTKVTLFELAEFADVMCSELFIIYKSEMLKWEKTEDCLSFFKRLVIGLMNEAMTNFIKADDVARTVGINTGYIKMLDFEMEDGDKQFLIQQGKRSTGEFLKQFVHDNLLEVDANFQSRKVPKKTSLSKDDLATIKKYQKQNWWNRITGYLTSKK